jgi:hypothetical protein
MQPSFVSINQWKSILKAIAYSFVAGFLGTLSLMALDFIKAAQAGTASVVDLGVALLAAAVIGGINGVAVFLKKVFTEPEK